MREGLFEVQLMATDGIPLAENDGFIIGLPGKEYSVRIAVHRSTVTGKFPFQHPNIKIGLYIDGVDVNYWKRLDFSTMASVDIAEVKFWGFKQNKSEVKSFTFSTPQHISSDLLDSIVTRDQALGQLRVVFFEAMQTTEVFANAVTNCSAPQAHFVSESKRFWQQASLATCGGRYTEKEKFNPVVRWNNISSEPAKTLVVNYHTLQMLEFMKQLDADDSFVNDNPSKRNIIDLTLEDENEEKSSSVKSRRLEPREETEQDEDDGRVTFIPVLKEVPLLDISGDDEKEHVWSAVRVNSSFSFVDKN